MLLLLILDMVLMSLYAALAIFLVLKFCGYCQIDLTLDVKNYWLCLLPVGYMLWLVTFLGLSAIEMQLRKWVLGYQKKRRSCIKHHFFNFYLTKSIYHRAIVFSTLPLVNILPAWPFFNKLFWLSYATSSHVGKDNLLIGFHFDPDLIYLGDHNIIGHGTVIACHTIILDPQGDFVIITAPVKIGSYVVIGAQSHLELGVEIEDHALIEVGSFIKPFTKIGKYEVWGGNPAKFIRKQDSQLKLDQPLPPENQKVDRVQLENVTLELNTLDDQQELQLKTIVAGALHCALEKVNDETSFYNHSNWDSVAQLDMGLQLERTFGVTLEPTECMQLYHLADLRRFIRERNPTAI